VAQHTVFEAELIGMNLGIELLHTKPNTANKKVMFGVDNQAAIMAASSSHNKPGHQYAARFYKSVRSIRKTSTRRGPQITIQWTAGHEDIEGNEMADRVAKHAALGNSSNTDKLPAFLQKGPLPASVSALRAMHTTLIKSKWKSEWRNSPRFDKQNRIDPTLPSNNFLKLTHKHATGKRVYSSILFQLRTGHIPLNRYLHCFKLVDSLRCPGCGDPDESVLHFLLQCPAYALTSTELWGKRKGKPS
jgi:ribonuclease HI